jgi:hypothetical protein
MDVVMEGTVTNPEEEKRLTFLFKEQLKSAQRFPWALEKVIFV